MPASDDRACEHCKAPLPARSGFSRGQPPKYCSARCCNRASLQRRSERRRAAATSAPVPEQPSAPAVPAPRPHDNGRAVRTQRHAEGARHRIDPTTCERDYSAEEFEFLKAVDRYKKERKRPFPTASELLQLAVSLGYRKVAPAGPLPGAK